MFLCENFDDLCRFLRVTSVHDPMPRQFLSMILAQLSYLSYFCLLNSYFRGCAMCGLTQRWCSADRTFVQPGMIRFVT